VPAGLADLEVETGENMNCTSALIICPEGASGNTVERRLLGLTIGERLLLSLQYAGIEKAAFIGKGQRPSSSRASIQIVEISDLDNELLVLSADTVFDRGLVNAPVEVLSSLPLLKREVNNLADIVENPERALGALPVQKNSTGQQYAIRVTDAVSRKLAQRCLLLSLRKPMDGFISRHLNRSISTRITRFLAPLGIRPDQLTFLIMMVGISSGVFAAFSEHWWCLVLSGLCFQGQSVLDGCDGEIARLTYRFSKRGQWLDTIGDDLTNYAFYAGLTVGAARMYDQWWIYLLGAVTFAFQWATTLTMYRRIFNMGTGDLLAIPDVFTKQEKNNTGVFGKIVKALRIISKRDTFSFILSLVTAAQFPVVAFVAMTAGTYPAFYGILSNELLLRTMEKNGQKIPKAG
jgi:hypothetical protein